MSDSFIYGFAFNQSLKEINLKASEHFQLTSSCNVTVPKILLDGEFTVTLDGETVVHTSSSDESNSYISFTYNHGTHVVRIIGTTVIPEFPSTIILLIFRVATLLGANLLKRRKHFSGNLC